MDPPSFSSFAPSFSSFPDFEQGSSKHVPPSHSSQHLEDNADAKRKRRSSKKDKDKKHKKTKSKADKAYDEKSRDDTRRGDAVLFDDDRESRPYAFDDRESRPVFYTDRKGDPLNVRFGGLYAKEVPKYQLVAWGKKILGLDGSWSVVHRGGGGLEVGMGGRRKIPSITDSSSRALLNAPPTRRLIPSFADASRYQESDGFIKLPSAKDHHGDQSYRSIERSKDDADSDYDSSMTSGSDLSAEDENEGLTLTSFQEKTRSLEQRLAADPSSISNWLSLLSHSLSQIPITSRSSTKTRADITLSIVSRALTSLPEDVPAHKLRLIYLQAGEEIWEASKLQVEWEKALKEGNADVKMAWLDWRTRMGGRTVDSVLDDALRILQLSTSELERLRIFWRAAVILRQAGHIERAMAMFQIQAELIFNVPSSSLRSSFEEQLGALEEYWESEAPRIGESGGSGWASWVAAGKPEHSFAGAVHPPQENVSNIADPYTSWACQEAQSDGTLKPPSRSTEPIADEDPFSTVLFSDVRHFLSAFSSVRARSAFRLVWLSFLGLHVPGLETLLSSSESTDDRWCEIHLSSGPYLASIYPPAPERRRITGSSYAGVIIGQSEEYSSGFGPVKTWGYRAVGPMDVFGEANWSMWTREDVQGVNVEFVRRVFERCRLGTSGDDTEWDVLNLSFEAVLNVKGALKVSRSLLANARESIVHWSAHARLERLRGRLDEARKIYRTVTSTPSSSDNKLSLGPLWYDWADMEWLAGQPDAAIQVIFRAAGLDGTTGLGIATLRAKRILDDTARTIPGTLWKVQESWLRLAALLELLTSSSSAECPLFLCAPIIKQGSIADESAAVSSLTMLYHHVLTLRGTAKPTVLRERLERALNVYPNNTAILGMFLEAQKGQGVWGRVRELLEVGTEDSGEQPKNVARRVADVWVAGWEKGRWDWEIERTRGGLAAAVESERTRGSPILWRLYIELEIRAGQLERAKDLLFRALGQCPFVKELYLLAFDALRSVFTGRELNALADSMAERGVRMRKGLDDVVGDWTEDKEEEESSGEEDEIEAEARERQRLRPY